MADDVYTEGIRSRVDDILKDVPALGQQINSTGATASLFTKLTGGMTQAKLQANWDKGGIMTCCNEFVGWYAAQLGSSIYLGRFDLETFLPGIGKGDAWVKSTKDARPKYGDICRHTAFHVGVSLDFNDDDTWNHVDGGQGGPKMGYDVIKRTRGATPYDYKNLVGWIDIEAYFDTPAKTPDWLQGWWKVLWRGQAYYYYFDENCQVKWTRIVPLNTLQPPGDSEDTGKVVVKVPTTVTVEWNGSGNVEKYTKPKASSIPMTGIWQNTEALRATSMQ